MEEQIPSSIPPQPMAGQITPEALEQMKQQARELAIAQYMTQQQAREKAAYQQPDPMPLEPPRNINTKRYLTVAELILIFAISIGIVTGTQFVWNLVSSNLPKIEVRIK